MIVKTLEVRDASTFIPVAAVQVAPRNAAQRYLARRCGYPLDRPQVILFRLGGTGPALSDPDGWPGRTMKIAHLYILQHFHALADGAVVDVEYLLGESPAPKLSEAGASPGAPGEAGGV